VVGDEIADGAGTHAAQFNEAPGRCKRNPVTER
jgi:hypothetical protein